MVEVVDQATAIQSLIEDALDELAEKISNVDNPTYEAMERRLPSLRKKMLTNTRWNFALRQAFLPPKASGLPMTLPDGVSFPYAYAYPDDMIRFIGVNDPHEPLSNYGISSSIDYKIANEALLSDTQQENSNGTLGLWVWYIKDIIDPRSWSDIFRELMVVELAIRNAYRVTTGAGKIRELKEEKTDILRRARVANSQENSPEIFGVTAGWVESRFGPLTNDYSRQYGWTRGS